MLAEEILSKLDILPLEGLKIHEQTIPENVRALRETMLNLGRLVDPLIVDGKHKVVLDGNHRRQVLEDLQSQHAVCQVVDYDDPAIKIGGWWPATLSLPAEKLGGEKVDRAAGMAALERMEACFLMIKKNGQREECRLFSSSEKKLRAVIDDQEALLAKLRGLGGAAAQTDGNGNGSSIAYIEDIRSPYFLEKGYWVMARRTFRKEEIVSEATAGRPLPPKSTRHLIPNRIIRLNFHLGYLNESHETAIQLLTEMVHKRVKYGSARYYTEPVIVLY